MKDSQFNAIKQQKVAWNIQTWGLLRAFTGTELEADNERPACGSLTRASKASLIADAIIILSWGI